MNHNEIIKINQTGKTGYSQAWTLTETVRDVGE